MKCKEIYVFQRLKGVSNREELRYGELMKLMRNSGKTLKGLDLDLKM